MAIGNFRTLCKKSELSILKRRVKLLFVSCLINLLLEYNNGRPDKTLFQVAGKERVFKKLLSYNKEDRENIYPYIDILRNENAKLFPIASDPAGNFICLYEGNIVFWEHETAKKQYICDTMTELIELLY